MTSSGDQKPPVPVIVLSVEVKVEYKGEKAGHQLESKRNAGYLTAGNSAVLPEPARPTDNLSPLSLFTS